MDKETLSNYGWIVICVLVLAVMIALATPFGTFIADGFKATYTGLFETGDSALDVGLNAVGVSNKLPCGHGRKEAGDHTQKECGHYNCQDDCGCVPASCGVDGHWSGDGKEHGIAVTSKNCYSGHRYTCECTAGWTVPEDGKYQIVSTGTVYNAGEQLPCGYETQNSDAYWFGDYVYRYNCYCGAPGVESFSPDLSQNGWSARIIDNKKTSYGEILESINGKPVTSLRNTFAQCYNMEVAPIIPNSVKSVQNIFGSCKNLKTYVGSTDPDGDFSGYVIPSSVTNISWMFSHCYAITTAPIIPNTVTNMQSAFNFTNNLTGTIVVHANPSVYENLFNNMNFNNRNVTLTGDSTMLDILGAAGSYGYCAECNGTCQKNH